MKLMETKLYLLKFINGNIHYGLLKQNKNKNKD